jgi:hypothetical protein
VVEPVVPPAPEFATQVLDADGVGLTALELCEELVDRKCVTEARQFAPGQTVWALLHVTNSTHAATELKVSYVAEGSEPTATQGIALAVPAQARYTTFSKAARGAEGRYEVVVTNAAGHAIGRASFAVRNPGEVRSNVPGETVEPAVAPPPVEPLAPVPPVAPQPAAAVPVAATGSSGGFGVAALSLCTAIESRHCTGETAVFERGQLVWALLHVSNASGAPTEVHVSYVAAGEAPAAGQGLALTVPVQERPYVTFAKASKSQPGHYDVVVSTADGTELARAGFEVR